MVVAGPPTPPVSVLALIASAVRNEDTQGGLDSGSSVTQGKLSVVVVVVMKTSVYCASSTMSTSRFTNCI